LAADEKAHCQDMKYQAQFKANSKTNMELNFSSRDNRRTGQVKANYFPSFRVLPGEKSSK